MKSYYKYLLTALVIALGGGVFNASAAATSGNELAPGHSHSSLAASFGSPDSTASAGSTRQQLAVSKPVPTTKANKSDTEDDSDDC